MPTKRPKKPTSTTETRKKTALGRKLSRLGKRYWAEVKGIAQRRDIPVKEARQAWKESFIETIRVSTQKVHQKRFIQVATTKRGKPQYREMTAKTFELMKTLGPGKDVWKKIYATTKGPRRSKQTVERSIKTSRYWGLVERTARYWHISQAKARELLASTRAEMQRVARLYGKRRKMRTRDAAAVLEFTDRYQNIRRQFGL